MMTMLMLTVAALVVAAVALYAFQPQRDADRSWFRLDRHDVRSTLPAAIRAMMQDGILDRMFQDALVPEFLFPATATNRPWNGNLGDTATMTRTGLLSPVTSALGGSDPSAATYTLEQWSMTMDQYGNAVDTNMLQSAMTLASKFAEDIQKLGINAGQSLNRIARNKLYSAYAGGRTVADGSGSSATALEVTDMTGFATKLVNGVPTAVSGTNKLDIVIGASTAAVVVAADGLSGPGTLTLEVAKSWSDGDAVVAATAPVSYRAGSRASYDDVTASDVATFALFRSAVARLRTMNVPTIGGAYVAHIDPTTEEELFDDDEFKALYAGAVESPVWSNLSLGRFAGIDWVRNNECPTISNEAGTVTVHRPIVMGGDALIAGPFAEMGNLLREIQAPTGDISLIGPANGVQVARIIRAPQDRLQQVISSAWSWVGDFAAPTDATTGDAAYYKRAVVIEHA